MWDSGATNSMINRLHTKPYKHKDSFQEGGIQYILRTVLYDACHQGAILYAVFSISKIIYNYFHTDNNEVESIICY